MRERDEDAGSAAPLVTRIVDFLRMLESDPERAAGVILAEAARLGPRISSAWRVRGLDVEEIIAETTERLWAENARALRRLNASASLQGAIAGVMRNVARERRRHDSHQAEESDRAPVPLGEQARTAQAEPRPIAARGEPDGTMTFVGGRLDARTTAKQRGAIRSLIATRSFQATARRLRITVPALLARLRRARTHVVAIVDPICRTERVSLPAASRATIKRMPNRWRKLYRCARRSRSRKSIAERLGWTIETTHGELKRLRKWLATNE